MLNLETIKIRERAPVVWRRFAAVSLPFFQRLYFSLRFADIKNIVLKKYHSFKENQGCGLLSAALRVRNTYRKERIRRIFLPRNVFSFLNPAESSVSANLALRLAFALSVIYLFPVYTALGISWETGRQEENGMGGGAVASGYEDALTGDVSAAGGTELPGVSEPESFSRPMLDYTSYKVEGGDNISGLAERFGLDQSTLFAVNNIKNARGLQKGQILKIPNQDGILHTVKKGETLENIVKKYGNYHVAAADIKTVNELFSDTIHEKTELFISGARLSSADMQERSGDLFMWPMLFRGRISSYYGQRRSPFTGARQFHTGIDLPAGTGTPVRAAMQGRVTSAGFDNVFGNYIVVTHHAGYRTLYAHLSVRRKKTGDLVGTGERIGDVGSTGLSTGPHLHFMVYKNGVTINPLSMIR